LNTKINFWMVLTLVLLGILLFVAGTFFPNPWIKKQENNPIPSVTVEPTISIIPTPTVEEEGALLQLQKAFAKKYNKELSEVLMTISQKDDTHASGSIKFLGETSGGWFLAYKTITDGWIIVQDGNGTISCETIAPYGFPQEMVSECVDANNNLVK